MRELKFRAWGVNIEEYMSQSFDGQEEIANVTRILGDLINWGDWVIEQYTGLKDKNGTEIYEGDIVLDYYDGEDAFIVKWDKDTASFILTGIDNIATVSFDNFYPDKDLKVIGNIHENPELLGDKK